MQPGLVLAILLILTLLGYSLGGAARKQPPEKPIAASSRAPYRGLYVALCLAVEGLGVARRRIGPRFIGPRFIGSRFIGSRFRARDRVETGDTEQIFTMPQDQRTQDRITGRFG